MIISQDWPHYLQVCVDTTLAINTPTDVTPEGKQNAVASMLLWLYYGFRYTVMVKVYYKGVDGVEKLHPSNLFTISGLIRSRKLAVGSITRIELEGV